jgi:hypothetical protein
MGDQMKKIKLLTVLACASLLTACSASTSATDLASLDAPSATPTPAYKIVSPERFKAALATYKSSVDEFNGHTEITPKSMTGIFFSDGIGHASVLLGFSKHDSKSEWKLALVSNYWGDDWLFHDTLDLKSSSGVVTLDVDPLTRDDQVSNGSVTEIAVTNLDSTQTDQICNVLQGKKPKARLTGTGGAVTDVVGFLPNAKLLRDGCTIWYGLQSGYKASN